MTVVGLVVVVVADVPALVVKHGLSGDLGEAELSLTVKDDSETLKVLIAVKKVLAIERQMQIEFAAMALKLVIDQWPE